MVIFEIFSALIGIFPCSGKFINDDRILSIGENNIIKRDKWTIVRDANCKIRKTIFFPLQGVLPAMFDNKMTVYKLKE